MVHGVEVTVLTSNDLTGGISNGVTTSLTDIAHPDIGRE